MKVRLTSRAETDATEAALYYQKQQTRAGEDFLNAIKRALGEIEAQPQAWVRVSKRLRCFILRKFPYKIIYQLNEDEIVVLAIIHAKRDPNVWRARE